MAHLPYRERQYHTVQVKEGLLKTRDFKIPAELTVEEVERLLEITGQIEKLKKEEIASENYFAQRAKIKEFWSYLFAQLTIIFQHYQPEVTTDYLKKYLTESEALRITKFFDLNRYYQAGSESSKKKVSAKDQLRELRRLLIFCVRYGFSLSDLKKLYIDEFFEYYYELVYNLEKSEVLKEGAYEKVQGIDKSADRLSQFFGRFK